MKNAEDLKRIVREKYSGIALASEEKSKGCGCGCSDTLDYSIFAEDYSNLDGYTAEADLQLGCGIPTEFAGIKPGNTVVDLGSGAGNDCFVALRETGNDGRVIGVDMSGPMVEKARRNAEKLNAENVEFLLGEIEQIPLPDETADVVISNCVLNLVPDKLAAFRETFRILKPGGHITISDIVLNGELPDDLLKDAEMYAGCVAGALQEREYLNTIDAAGFKEVRVLKKRSLDLPSDLINKYNAAKLLERDGGPGIYSITLRAEK